MTVSEGRRVTSDQSALPSAQRTGKKRARERAPCDIGIFTQGAKRLADVVVGLRLPPKLEQAGPKRRSPLRLVEVVCQGHNRPAVQIEPPLRISTGREQQECPSRRGVNLILVDPHLLTRNRSE